MRSYFKIASMVAVLSLAGCSAPTESEDATSDTELTEAEAAASETTARTPGGFEITIRPSAFIIRKGGTARYDIWANGWGNQANLQFSSPPIGVRQSSSPWLPLGSMTQVRLRADESAPNQDRMQHVSATVFDNGQWQTADAWVRIVVRP
jgi:hypothetical protein